MNVDVLKALALAYKWMGIPPEDTRDHLEFDKDYEFVEEVITNIKVKGNKNEAN